MIHTTNFITGRVEIVDKDESAQLASHSGIRAYTIGYTRDIAIFPRLETGIGANFSTYSVPDAIKTYYGDRPIGGNVFVRIRLKGASLMKPTLLILDADLRMLAAAGTPQTITGVITDTMCGAKHTMTKGQPDDECARLCVKGSREFAFYDGKGLWKLSDQKTPARFAAKPVKVTGTADPKTMTIKVTSIEPAE